MRILLTTAASIVALALTAPAQADSANTATSAQKPSEHASIGVAAAPDRLPADPRAPKLRRPPIANAAASVVPPSIEKPQPFGISNPPNPAALSAAQRQKLADAMANQEPVAAPEVTGLKPAERSTIVPLEAGRRPVSVEGRKLPPLAIQAPLAGRTGAGSFSRVLGVIPRPEWSAGATPAKPKDVSTIGTVPTDPIPSPAVIEPHRVTPPGMKAEVQRKPAEVSTSAPRDPSLPPPSATKAAPSKEQEVRP